MRAAEREKRSASSTSLVRGEIVMKFGGGATALAVAHRHKD